MTADKDARILITGSQGFLGWHLRIRLLALGFENVVPVGRSNWSKLPGLVEGTDVVFHLAGINRDDDDILETGNRRLAEELRSAFGNDSPSRVIFANTIQAELDNPYGRGKAGAAEVLARWMSDTDRKFTDVRLPNLFGEHGQPFYNSFVATFVELLVTGQHPTIEDRQVPLLHAQQAAQVLIDAIDAEEGRLDPVGTPVLVSEVWRILETQYETYLAGTIPDISQPLHRDLFNTLRTRVFIDRPGIALPKNIDARGMFVETARATRGQGQTSFSTTVSGITRGQHYHLRKLERFVVLSGEAIIGVRKVFGADGERFDLEVKGSEPVAVDMPTGWTHKITNTGNEVLITQFWISEFLDPADPDTTQEEV